MPKKKDNAYCIVIQLVRKTGLALSSKLNIYRVHKQARVVHCMRWWLRM